MFHHVFRLSRPGGGYAYFGEPHHLPALFYLQFSFIGLVLAALSAAAILVVLLPVIHRKAASMLIGITAIGTGTVAGYCLIIPEWQVGFLTLPSDNGVLSYTQPTHHLHNLSHPISVQLGLRIGLLGANFTLSSKYEGPMFYWDERVEFDSLKGMKNQFVSGLTRGLPVAILELQEQVAGCGDKDFMWPFWLRQAGYFCSWMLCGVLSLWMISCVLLMAVPTLGAASLAATGVSLLATVIIYVAMVPAVSGPAGRLRVTGLPMPLVFGPCFWTCLATGLWVTAVGTSLVLYHAKRPDEFFTVFDLDYDNRIEIRRQSKAVPHGGEGVVPGSGMEDTRL